MGTTAVRRSMMYVLSGVVIVFSLVAGPLAAGAVPIEYLAPSHQTATADYSFIDGTHLQIILTETTPAADFTGVGAAAILTGVGFLLPGTVEITNGTATVNTGSTSVGFSPGCSSAQCGAGADVSGEWGATHGKRPIGTSPETNWDFASVVAAQVNTFSPGANRDNTPALDGPQGGLLDDSASRGGLGVVDNSVTLVLTLTGTGLTPTQETAFLEDVKTDSIVEFGSDASFGTPRRPPQQVPEPTSLLLLGGGLVSFVVLRRVGLNRER
jgi:PEP-CTERM motif-containing protein